MPRAIGLGFRCISSSRTCNATGAFKVRGALSKVKTFTLEERQRGVICASSGNHGLGVAYAASRMGARCIVVLPENANPHKVALLKGLGAEIVLHGITSDVRQMKVDELSALHGYVQVHPFSDPALIAGQGTVGLEILEDLPDADEVYVPIGGGGLISGISTAIKEQRPATRVYGVEPELSNAMSEAIRHGGPVALDRVETIADGLAAKITEELNVSIVRRYVDDILLVSDRDILNALFFLLEYAKILVEPSAAASFAGLLANPKRKRQSRCRDERWQRDPATDRKTSSSLRDQFSGDLKDTDGFRQPAISPRFRSSVPYAGGDDCH